MKKYINRIRDFISDSLRSVCGRISPDKRVAVIAVMFVVFAVVNIYLTFKAIYNIGREDARQEVIDIQSIRIPELIQQDTLSSRTLHKSNDSLNLNTENIYGK